MSSTSESEETNSENWYVSDVEKRIKRIERAGIKRNKDKKRSVESSKSYDNLKRAFYNVTESAFLEGDITDIEKDSFISKLRKLDKQSLEELKNIEKPERKSDRKSKPRPERKPYKAWQRYKGRYNTK